MTGSLAIADDAPKPRFGVAVRDTSNNAGVYVVSVDEGSPASRMRRVADGSMVTLQFKKHAIIGFNGWRIRNSQEYVEAMAYAPKRCVFEVYDYDQKASDFLQTELNGDPTHVPTPPAIPATGTATTSEPAGQPAQSGDGRMIFRDETFFGQRAGTAETTGNITIYRRPWLNQHEATAETNGNVTEYYSPKFLGMQQKYGTAEDHGNKTIYRDAWGRKGATAEQEGDRTVYRDWLGRKFATAREENGRMVYRNWLGQKIHSSEGNSDPRRDGMIGIMKPGGFFRK
jgi:hypothetical protein